MTTAGSVTHWLNLLPEGDSQAAQQLWQTYFHQLVRLARSKLRNYPCRVVDEEDLALSAFDSFCRGVEQGRFPRLEDRNNLWRLLVTITARKVQNLKRDGQRQKRGGIDTGPGADNTRELEDILGKEPSPDFAAEMVEQYQRLLDLLGTDELRRVALWKMEGFTNSEIAAKLPSSPRSVDRKLVLIRDIWERKGAV